MKGIEIEFGLLGAASPLPLVWFTNHHFLIQVICSRIGEVSFLDRGTFATKSFQAGSAFSIQPPNLSINTTTETDRNDNLCPWQSFYNPPSLFVWNLKIPPLYTS